MTVRFQQKDRDTALTRVYLSGPIVNEQLRADDFYAAVVKTLEHAGVSVFAPQLLPRTQPEVIFDRDVQEVRLSDVIVAEVSHPSHGVGMEIMLAIELMKPLLLFRKTGSGPLSYMVLGAHGKALFEYSSTDDVVNLLESLDMDSLLVQKCPNCTSEIVEITDKGLRCIVCRSDFDVSV